MGRGSCASTGSEGWRPARPSQTLTCQFASSATPAPNRAPQMLENTQFVDAKAQVFAKYGSTQWTLIGEFPVERQLIAK